MLHQALAGFKAKGRFYRRGDQFDDSEARDWPNWKSMLSSKMVGPVTPDNDLSQASKTKYPAPHVVDDRLARERAALKAKYEAQHAAPNLTDKQRKDAEMAANAKRDAGVAAAARAKAAAANGGVTKGLPPVIIEDKAALAAAAAKAAFDAGHVKPVVAAAPVTKSDEKPPVDAVRVKPPKR